jgi:hypothetical protein
MSAVSARRTATDRPMHSNVSARSSRCRALCLRLKSMDEACSARGRQRNREASATPTRPGSLSPPCSVGL